jgi:hypothetical protein
MRKIGKCFLVGVLILGMATSAASHEVGWILLVPPISVYDAYGKGNPRDYAPNVQIDAPSSKWLVDKPFDTARECEEYRLKVYEDASKALMSGAMLDAYDQAKPYRYWHARCVPASVVYPQVKER